MRMIRHISKRDYNKARTRGLAIEWQIRAIKEEHSLQWYINWQARLYVLARKYGLLREFRNNGIL